MNLRSSLSRKQKHQKLSATKKLSVKDSFFYVFSDSFLPHHLEVEYVVEHNPGLE